MTEGAPYYNTINTMLQPWCRMSSPRTFWGLMLPSFSTCGTLGISSQPTSWTRNLVWYHSVGMMTSDMYMVSYGQSVSTLILHQSMISLQIQRQPCPITENVRIRFYRLLFVKMWKVWYDKRMYRNIMCMLLILMVHVHTMVMEFAIFSILQVEPEIAFATLLLIAIDWSFCTALL